MVKKKMEMNERCNGGAMVMIKKYNDSFTIQFSIFVNFFSRIGNLKKKKKDQLKKKNSQVIVDKLV